MALFDRIPERFFSILASPRQDIYVEALFVLRRAFHTELEIHRSELTAMMIDSLEPLLIDADLDDEEEFSGGSGEAASGGGNGGPGNRGTGGTGGGGSGSADAGLSGKVQFLVRRLRETGWLEIEMESRSFEEYVTVPDYAVAVMDLLYDLSSEQVREYNSYVYATYAALENAAANSDFMCAALLAANQNTEALITELKSLYNNIRRYYQKALKEFDVNELLAEHFDVYREQIVNAVYYPLKTIDSVPRFKHAIQKVLREWLENDPILDMIAEQGVSRRVFENEEEGRERTIGMINFIADTYDNIEDTIGRIDVRHAEYTRASIDRVRYFLNTDRSARGRLVDLLRESGDERIGAAMEENLTAFRHSFADNRSLYNRMHRTRRTEGKPLALEEKKENPGLVSGFLSDVRRQYSNRRIDAFAERCFGGRDEFTTADVLISGDEDFILFLLATMRGAEKSAPFTAEFREGNTDCGGYSLPDALFRRKKKGGKNGKSDV